MKMKDIIVSNHFFAWQSKYLTFLWKNTLILSESSIHMNGTFTQNLFTSIYSAKQRSGYSQWTCLFTEE